MGRRPSGLPGRGLAVRPVHLAQLDKTRPVVVLTRAHAIGRLSTVTVAPITSTIHGLATEVAVGAANGLDHDSVINLDNVYTIRSDRLGRQVGCLHDEQEPGLRAALVRAFDLQD